MREVLREEREEKERKRRKAEEDFISMLLEAKLKPDLGFRCAIISTSFCCDPWRSYHDR